MDGQATQGPCCCPVGGFLRFFSALPDPRATNVIHRLSDILAIAFCAVLSGAESWVEVELFGKSKIGWLKTFLELPQGIPSHDTFGRVFAALDPQAFERCFQNWMAWLKASGTRLIAIDGKAIRHSFEHSWDQSGMAHLLSAYAVANRRVLGQLSIGSKANEITAIPKLLAMLDLEGAIVTIDAIGCQRAIASQITQAGGDYVLVVKENQPALHGQVKALLDEAMLEGFAGREHQYQQQVEGDHGRIETRRIWHTSALEGLRLCEPWPALASLAVVEAKREVIGQPPSIERRYFISSLATPDAPSMAAVIRAHWHIENSLHWQLDVSFREDERRIRKGHGAENFSRLCRLALNCLKSDRSVKAGIAARRRKAGWDEAYLLKLLTS